MAVTFKIEEVTPNKAAQWLKKNENNRNLIQSRLALYERQFEEDKWEITGEAIKFDDDGNLIDGQHRLTACVNTGKAFKTLVVRGLPPEVKDVVDTGATRTAKHVLQMHQIKYHTEIPSTLRSLRKIDFAEEYGVWPANNTKNFTPLTNQEILRLSDDPALLQAIVETKRDDARSFLRPSSAFAALRYYLKERNLKRSTEFFESLTNGVGLTKDSPILKLRNLLIKTANTNTIRRPVQWKIAVTLKAWNLFLADQSVANLSFRQDEDWPQTTKRYRPRVRKKKR